MVLILPYLVSTFGYSFIMPFKARYFPHSNILKAVKGQGGSFIWSGIWTAKEELCKGFRWVIGDGNDIVAAKDPWLRTKNNFCVDPDPVYEDRNEVVSSLFMPNERKWDINLVRERFLHDDAEVILGVRIPQRDDVRDKIVWTGSNDGIYNVKNGYHYWSNLRVSGVTALQSLGWKKIWHLKLPPKIKTFIWRFCSNIIPVRKRLSSRGVRIPITCPMCLADIEHILHLFFDYKFAADCWAHVQFNSNWNELLEAQTWLLDKISSASSEEVVKICVILWVIWFWRNKRVWDGKVVTSAFAMDSSFKHNSSWLVAKSNQECTIARNKVQ